MDASINADAMALPHVKYNFHFKTNVIITWFNVEKT